MVGFGDSGQTFPIMQIPPIDRGEPIVQTPNSVAKPLCDKVLRRAPVSLRTIGTFRADGKIEKKLPFGIIGNRHL